jgi:hypothetical protein
MIGIDLQVTTAPELARLVRALGGHRYVAGRLHLVHAFAYASLSEAGLRDGLDEAIAWAAAVLDDATIDPSSRDERLFRRSTDAEVAAVLEGFVNRLLSRL